MDGRSRDAPACAHAEPSRLRRSAGAQVSGGPGWAEANNYDGRGYWAGRAPRGRRAEDLGTSARSFASFWLGRERITTAAPEIEHVTLAVDDDSVEGAEGDDTPVVSGPTITVRYSAHEVLRHKDFAAYSTAEFAEARRLMADLRLAGALRRSRRQRPAARRTSSGPRPDLRRTVRAALRAGGEPVRRAFLEPSERPRRVVLLCDVSGSMEPYARALVRFLQAAVSSKQRGKVEAFAMGTRLTRITRELSS